MSAPKQGSSKKIIMATNCRQLVREEPSKGESSKGKSSTRRPLMEFRGLDGEPMVTTRKFLSLCREVPHEGPSEVALEMQPMDPCLGDDERPRSKGKKKADKGKAVYRDPWIICNQAFGEEEKRQEVEPKQAEGETSDLSGALSKLRLDSDEYQQELEKAKRKQVHVVPCDEAEDGWMVVKEDLGVWDSAEENGRVQPD